MYITAKLPCCLIKSPADLDHCLDRLLERLQTDRIDYSLLQSMHRHFWKNLRKHKVFDWLDKAEAMAGSDMPVFHPMAIMACDT